MIPNDSLKICCPLRFLFAQSSKRTMINAEFSCLLLFPNPGTLNNNLLISPFPTFGKNLLSISKAFSEV